MPSPNYELRPNKDDVAISFSWSTTEKDPLMFLSTHPQPRPACEQPIQNWMGRLVAAVGRGVDKQKSKCKTKLSFGLGSGVLD